MAATITSDVWFPQLRREHVLACQTSAWYPTFERKSIKCTIIPALGQDFRAYLESDGVIIPEGAEDRDPNIEMSDDEDQTLDSDEPEIRYSFPELDSQIRQAISAYGAVFPKLNWTAPKDAAWMLSTNAPLRCTSPADVYLLLKSSDFAMHDLDEARVFEGCVDQTLHLGEPDANRLNEAAVEIPSSNSEENQSEYKLELVLKKWYEVERSREVRCFIRDNNLLAICQRDPNFFEHLVPQETQDQIRTTVSSFWRREIKHKFANGRVTSYVLDLLLTRDLSRAHVVDFNPYAPRTDPILFEWSELADLHERAQASNTRLRLESLSLEGPTVNGQSLSDVELPPLRIVTSPNQATRPAYSHNMVPAEALSDNAMQFAAQMAVEMAQRAREAQEAEGWRGER